MTCIVGRWCVQPETACRPHEWRIQTAQVGATILRKPEVAGIVEGKVVSGANCIVPPSSTSVKLTGGEIFQFVQFRRSASDSAGNRRSFFQHRLPSSRGNRAGAIGGNQERAKRLILHPRCCILC